MFFLFFVAGITILVIIAVKTSNKHLSTITPRNEPSQSEIAWKEQVGKKLSGYEVNKAFQVWYPHVTDYDKFNLGISLRRKMFLLYSEQKGLQYSYKFVTIPFNSIVDCELIENGGVIAQGGVGRAIVGGVLAGGAGAVVGAATRKSHDIVSELSVRIVTKDVLNPMINLTIMRPGSNMKRSECTEYLTKAREIYSTITSIMNQ